LARGNSINTPGWFLPSVLMLRGDHLLRLDDVPPWRPASTAVSSKKLLMIGNADVIVDRGWKAEAERVDAGLDLLACEWSLNSRSRRTAPTTRSAAARGR